jgi:hypothetical protein
VGATAVYWNSKTTQNSQLQQTLDAGNYFQNCLQSLYDDQFESLCTSARGRPSNLQHITDNLQFLSNFTTSLELKASLGRRPFDGFRTVSSFNLLHICYLNIVVTQTPTQIAFRSWHLYCRLNILPLSLDNDNTSTYIYHPLYMKELTAS